MPVVSAGHATALTMKSASAEYPGASVSHWSLVTSAPVVQMAGAVSASQPTWLVHGATETPFTPFVAKYG